MARKHCGRQSAWRISLALLQKKCGATSAPREFRRLISKIVDQDKQFAHIPDYSVEFESEDVVLFRNRGTVRGGETNEFRHVAISGDGYEEAKLAAPGWDIYVIEQEWPNWMSELPRDADAAFVGFCQKWFERRGAPA